MWWGAAAGWPSAATRVAASPSWATPPGGAGAHVKITAVAAAASVQLAVNGAPVGARVPVSRLGSTSWTVPFAPGAYTVSSTARTHAPQDSFVVAAPPPARTWPP